MEERNIGKDSDSLLVKNEHFCSQCSGKLKFGLTWKKLVTTLVVAIGVFFTSPAYFSCLSKPIDPLRQEKEIYLRLTQLRQRALLSWSSVIAYGQARDAYVDEDKYFTGVKEANGLVATYNIAQAQLSENFKKMFPSMKFVGNP